TPIVQRTEGRGAFSTRAGSSGVGQTAAVEAADVLDNVRQIADRFAADRRTRQLRTDLVGSEFDELADAGLSLSGVPVDQGGLWESMPASTRAICELLRTLAGGDSSVALV